MTEWKMLLLVGLVFIVGVESRPHELPPALVFNLFPRSIIATVLQMTPKQRLNFARLYVKYKQNSQETDEELEAKMFEELKEHDKPLFELMWPAIMEVKVRMGRMNDKAKVFFEEYMQKATEIAPLLRKHKDLAVQKLLKFAVNNYDQIDSTAKEDLKREFPAMALSFEDKDIRDVISIDQ